MDASALVRVAACMQVKSLFNVTGESRFNPVTDISFVSIGVSESSFVFFTSVCIPSLWTFLFSGFRDTAYTYMDPHTIASGGDWTIARSGVVALENTERVSISGCVFSRVDGNAVLISRLVEREFKWREAT